MRMLAVAALAGALAACGAAGGDAPACDRACLIELTDTYIAGIEGQSLEGIPFSDEVVIVENLQRIGPGEGLWAEATGKGTDFSIVVPDEQRQTAGWLGMVERDGVPTIVAVRLKLDPRGSIVEAEHLYAAIDSSTPLGESQLANLQAVRPGLLAEVPAESRKSGDELIAIGETYYPALDDNDGSLMPFADDC